MIATKAPPRPGASPAADSQDAAHTYPGVEESVPLVRHMVAAATAGHAYCADAQLVATELASNAIRHSRSGDERGTFTVSVHAAAGRVRIEVHDMGGHLWRTPSSAPLALTGRGLALVTALCDKWEHATTRTGQTVWAVVSGSGRA